MTKEGRIDLETIKKNADGWKLLSESSPVFIEKFNHFIREAAIYVDTSKFNINASIEDGMINYETYNYGSDRVDLSYTSGIKDRDLDCQYKVYRKIIFYLNGDKLAINELSGRLESKYGYNFENTNGGLLKTNYAYQEFTKEGIELLYRGYSDTIKIKPEAFLSHNYGLSFCVNGGYYPNLAFKDKLIHCRTIGDNPRYIELSRSLDNLGLIKEKVCSFDNKKNAIDKKEEYHLNTFMTTKHDVNPYLIHINRGVMPLVYLKDGKFLVNYTECGVTLNNFQDLAKFRFVTGATEKMRELQSELGELPKEDQERRVIIQDLINKYETLSHMYNSKEKGTRK